MAVALMERKRAICCLPRSRPWARWVRQSSGSELGAGAPFAPCAYLFVCLSKGVIDWISERLCQREAKDSAEDCAGMWEEWSACGVTRFLRFNLIKWECCQCNQWERWSHSHFCNIRLTKMMEFLFLILCFMSCNICWAAKKSLTLLEV